MGSESPRVPAKFLVNPCKDRLPARIVPVNFDPSIWIEKVGFQMDGPSSIIVAHDQVKDGMV